MPRPSSILLFAVALQSSVALAQTTVFQDDFSVDPGSGGWTEVVQESIIIGSNGSSATFGRTTTGSNVEATITRTVSTVGFSNIISSILGTQLSTFYEPQDYVALRYNLNNGNGFQTLYQANGELIGDAFNTGGLLLPAGANNNPLLQFQIAANFNANVEGYNIDSFTVQSLPTLQTFVAEPFNLDPAANGWTEAVQDGINIDNDGGSGFARFYRPSGANGINADASITKSFSTEGYEFVAMQLTGNQANTTFEADDFIELAVDLGDGNGYVSFFKRFGNLPSNLFDTGLVLLPSAAFDNPNVSVRITTNFNAGVEAYRLDELTLLGLTIVAIPEPASRSTWCLVVAAVLGCVIWNSRQRPISSLR